VQLDSRYTQAHSNLLRDLQHLPDITPEQLLAEHQNWWNLHGKPIVPQQHQRRTPHKPLRVGFVSPDLRNHAVAIFIAPLFEHHDKTNFHFTAYSEAAAEDEVSAKLKSWVQLWRPIRGHRDDLVAQQIAADQIDILIDLAGHTSNNRAPLFTQKPAPIQISYLGYPCTTGLPTIDYRITDAQADPPGLTEPHYTEKLLRLPRCAWCFRPIDDSPDVNDLPALTAGHITFGSFNNFAKANDAVLAAWAAVLNRVPNSRLILKSNGLAEPTVQSHIHQIFGRHNISPDRLTMLDKNPDIAQHLARYHDIDIALDTFPYNGTTTTCEALWMGIPVICIAGNKHMSRVGVSLLHAIGLDDLIARDTTHFTEIAADLANDLPRLADLRRTLRARMLQSALRDETAFTRDFESLLQSILP